MFAARARGLKMASVRGEFEEIVKMLGLQSRLRLSAEKLSGGERQRVSLARALICQPRFLILDEPFAHLDGGAKKEAQILTEKAISRLGAPALIISHDMEGLKQTARKIFVLQNGSLLCGGSGIRPKTFC